MSDYIIDQQNVFDDSDFLYEEYLKTQGGLGLCKECNYNKKDEGHDDCKFCARKKMKGGRVMNISKPLHRSLDLMEQRDLQYDV